MGGVAYTTGSRLDNDHKEIHVSLEYIAGLHYTVNGETSEKGMIATEIKGVLQHELVHCFQCDGDGTCPGGLIEGIAGIHILLFRNLTHLLFVDWIRLKSGLSAPHWKRGTPKHEDGWDAGYERTAYFLDWVDITHGKGNGSVIRKLNESMAKNAYDKSVWENVTGLSVQSLWEEYCM